MPCHDRGPLFPDCLDPNAAMTTPTPDALTLALQPLLVPAFTLWEAPFTWLPTPP
jgi:nicotinamide mononucleotide transporter